MLGTRTPTTFSFTPRWLLFVLGLQMHFMTPKADSGGGIFSVRYRGKPRATWLRISINVNFLLGRSFVLVDGNGQSFEHTQMKSCVQARTPIMSVSFLGWRGSLKVSP